MTDDEQRKVENKARTRLNRIRRVANRKGLELQKCRCRNKKDPDYGKARLCDIRTGQIVFGDLGGYGKSIIEIEEYLYIGD